MSYWAIDTESFEGTMKEVQGPFETRTAAETFIRREFEAWWESSEVPLADRDETVSGTWLIVQNVAEVRPVGRATLKTRIVEVKE